MCVCVYVHRFYSVCSNTHLSHHRLTPTTLTFESNPSSPLARPCSTKDNPHRSAPAPCLLSCDNGRATKPPPTFSSFLFFFSLVSCHYLCEVFAAVLCEHERMFLCAFFTSRQKKKKKDENVTSWQFDGYCFFFVTQCKSKQK